MNGFDPLLPPPEGRHYLNPLGDLAQFEFPIDADDLRRRYGNSITNQLLETGSFQNDLIRTRADEAVRVLSRMRRLESESMTPILKLRTVNSRFLDSPAIEATAKALRFTLPMSAKALWFRQIRSRVQAAICCTAVKEPEVTLTTTAGYSAYFEGPADATDGIEVVSKRLSPTWPRGLFVAMNSGHRNFLFFPGRNIELMAIR